MKGLGTMKKEANNDELIAELRRYNNDGTEELRRQAADAIEELEKQLDEETEFATALSCYVPQWIPVTERLPDGNEDVLVTDGDACAVGYFRPDANAWDSCEFGWIENRPDPYPSGLGKVTHWMPLPEPPKESES